jgi:hypothetical protein
MSVRGPAAPLGGSVCSKPARRSGQRPRAVGLCRFFESSRRPVPSQIGLLQLALLSSPSWAGGGPDSQNGVRVELGEDAALAQPRQPFGTLVIDSPAPDARDLEWPQRSSGAVLPP